MSQGELASLRDRKKAIREQAHANRRDQQDKDGLSQLICQKFVSLAEYERAQTIMYYLDVRTEVRTRHYLPTALASSKKIVVPYCVEGALELFHLQNMDELDVGMYKILEPKSEMRSRGDRRVEVDRLDLIMVPGVAFDRTGARMGHGMGYYDKLLEHAPPDAPLIALAFECQLFPEIPTADHDIFMDKIVTETSIYQGRGRS